MFGGKFRTTLMVPYAIKDLVIVEDWWSVRLVIQRDQIQTQSRTLYLTYLILNLFKSLILVARVRHWKHSNRSTSMLYHLYWFSFLYDANAGGVGKVGKQVRFGPESDIANGAFPTLALRRKELTGVHVVSSMSSYDVGLLSCVFRNIRIGREGVV
ncbi:hypothetical protein F5887DRAFT_650320 [Amanita rubescens]|nr:hypothetical protein F5887DRAFT_650320 [Amanita rubescens]